ncbi:MAG: fumarylacetoacetate hydrolase family protein [Acidobacteriota bacterium]
MLLYRTTSGWVMQNASGKFFSVPQSAQEGLTTREDLFEYLNAMTGFAMPLEAAPANLRAPIESQEVWAAGVTYYRSRSARMAESHAAGGGDFYDRVYSAERPELFMKAVAHRVVGPESPVRIRRDSKWNVPEPELTLLISPKGKILGYTAGNDMSSRDIEGENPLYLPQAKVYDGSCALGPAILVTPEPLPSTTKISVKIQRGEKVMFNESTTLAEMKRTPVELSGYLYRENSFPQGAMLMTGTGVVPPDTFTLLPGDRVEVAIEGIGVLGNTVEQLA